MAHRLTDDIAQNGGYINPPEIKRQFRDPHADWWDKQERRNYGEPVHENHDQMGMFTPYEYTWVSPAKGLAQFGAFVVAFVGLCYTVRAFYPDKKSYPREFEGGLERELGGAGAVRVSVSTVTVSNRWETSDGRLTRNSRFRQGWLAMRILERRSWMWDGDCGFAPACT